MARKSTINVTSRAAVAKVRNTALARRLASGNVQGGGNRPIPLLEPERWHTYIANTYQHEDEFYRIKELGWEPLTPEDLACKVEESGYRLSEDGHLVRGEKGREMVFKMDAEDYKVLEQAKTATNMRGIGSAKKAKDDVVEAASSHLGDEAASYLNSLDGSVMDKITGVDG